MTRQEAAAIVAVLIAAYPTQSARLDEAKQRDMVNAFATLLDDLDYAECNAAVRALLQTRNWMPSVAEIRAMVVELQHGATKPGGEAWGEVLEAVGRYGSYRSPLTDFSFGDPLTAKCVASIGWRNICLSENMPADRARFIELYDRLATEVRREKTSPMLAAATVRRRLEETAKSNQQLSEPVEKLVRSVAESTDTTSELDEWGFTK